MVMAMVAPEKAAPAKAPTMAQINVRIDAELKKAGDEELARLGISPSEIVRALWTKLARGDHQVRATVEQLVSQERTPERQAEVDRKLKALEDFDQHWLKFAEELGLDPATHVPLTDEELEEERYQYYLEKYGM